MNRDRASAVAIILGAVAFVVTMALHPTGGDLDHILKIAPVVVGTHSLALASLALVVLGFLGLTVRLSEDVLAPAGDCHVRVRGHRRYVRGGSKRAGVTLVRPSACPE